MVNVDGSDSKSFLGREADVEAVRAALERSPFVVLLGPGGAGKTRLARWIIEHEREGCGVFCDLSAARSKGDVVGALAAALGVQLGAGPSEAVAAELGSALASLGDVVVVLDNLETIGDGVDVLRSWSASASPRSAAAGRRGRAGGPTLLGTSRVKLGLDAELDVEIGPLAPDAAVALFVERARLVAPELVADDTVRALVERLEGSPLAIELAAARSHVLGPRALLERFEKQLDLVRSTGGALPPRHRSLRAVVEGSWDLSTPSDREALSAASVFRGGFDLDAAEAVLGPLAADALESLLASSLVHRAASPNGAPRFALYDSVRELATERLAADPARADAARRAHAEHYRSLAVRWAEGMLNAEPEAVALQVLESENLLAAFRADPRSALAFNAVLHRALPADAHTALLRDALARAADDDVGARAELVLSLARAVRREGGADRALAHAEAGVALAAASGRADLVVDASYVHALALFDVGRLDEATRSARASVELARSVGAHATLARAHDLLGWIAIDRGDFVGASRLAEEALAIARERGYRLLESFAENLLGAVHGRRGELDLARSHLERGLAIVRALANRWQEAIVLGNLAKVSLLRGDLDTARAELEQALAVARAVGSRKTEAAHLVGLAGIDLERGRLADARAAAAHAESLAREIHQPRMILASSLTLGAVALEERRLDEAAEAFERASVAARAVESASSDAVALAGLAVARALGGDASGAERLVSSARALAADAATESAAILDAREAAIAFCRATPEDLARARSLLDRSARWAGSSADVRVARRLALGLVEGEDLDVGSEPPPSPRGRFELVTRSGAARADGLPVDADLAFDAITRVVVVEGRAPLDLRKKPIAARLLEVLLAEPGGTFEKTQLFAEVWHVPFRNASQGSALYKAVDRLAHLLDEDPRRFFRWDEAGRLAIVAKRPALLRPLTFER